MYFIKTVIGIFFTIFCSLIFFQAIYDLSLEEAEDEKGVVMALLVICLVGTLLSIRMILKARKGKKKAVQEKQERRILRLITQKGGRVTPFEIASETSLTIEEAQDALDRMCENGFGQLQVADTGSTIYVFYGIMSDHEKKSAKNPMEI